MSRLTGSGEGIWWYECDVLPVVGFVRADDVQQAKAAALDDAVARIASFLEDGTWKLDRVLPIEEVASDNASRT